VFIAPQSSNTKRPANTCSVNFAIKAFAGSVFQFPSIMTFHVETMTNFAEMWPKDKNSETEKYDLHPLMIKELIQYFHRPSKSAIISNE
jgi:uncharacterized membrane protein